jgi:ribosome-associated translation inhibitor RaiA
MPIVDRIRGMLEFGGPRAEIQVEHSGRVQEYDRPRLDAFFKSFVGKYEDLIPIEKLFVDVKLHNASGKEGRPERRKYSMHAYIDTGKDRFRSTAHGWDVFMVADEVLHSLRKQAVHQKGKSRTIRMDKRRRAKQ